MLGPGDVFSSLLHGPSYQIKELETMHYLKIQLFKINQTLEEEYIGVKNKEVLLDHQLSCMLKIE